MYTPYAPTAIARPSGPHHTSSSGCWAWGAKCVRCQEYPPSALARMISSWPTAMPCRASAKHTPVSKAWVGVRVWIQWRPASSLSSTCPRSPTATSLGPAFARSSSRDTEARRAGSEGNSATSMGAPAPGAPAARTPMATVTVPPSSARPKAASRIRRSAVSSVLADAAHQQHAGLIVRRGALDREVVRPGLLVLQSERQVAAVRQIHHQLQRRPQGRHIVVVDDVPFLHAVQLAAAVIAVHGQDLPGIFIHVQRAAAVEMAGAGLERRVDHPHAVQLVAREVLVDVVLLEDVGVFERVALQSVRVVGDDHFPLAEQLPVVTLRAPVVHVELVGGAQVIGVGPRIVEGHIGRAAHAALAWVVDPRPAVLLRLVQRLVHEQDLAREPGGLGRLLREV